MLKMPMRASAVAAVVPAAEVAQVGRQVDGDEHHLEAAHEEAGRQVEEAGMMEGLASATRRVAAPLPRPAADGRRRRRAPGVP
jgi:hypothetical protein